MRFYWKMQMCQPMQTLDPVLSLKLCGTLWKVRLPLKICNLVWKVIHDSVPTFQALKGRGIPIAALCPFCDCDEESASHLFLHCHFARACWYGSTLALHTSSLGPTAIQQWIINSIIRHKSLDESGMKNLQLIFITLWAIWIHRNRVIHEGVTPDPMNVILTTQNLFCMYQRSFKIITVLIIGYLGRKLWLKVFMGSGASSSRLLVSGKEERREMLFLMRLGPGRVQWCSTGVAAVQLDQSQVFCLKALEKQL